MTFSEVVDQVIALVRTRQRLSYRALKRELELSAVMSLVRLRQSQATQPESRTTQHEARVKLDEARNMLSEVYHWFTEGFDTKDLQEAKTLLDELADLNQR